MVSQWDNFMSLSLPGRVSGTHVGSPAQQIGARNPNIGAILARTAPNTTGLSVEKRQSGETSPISPNNTNPELGNNLYRELQIMNGNTEFRFADEFPYIDSSGQEQRQTTISIDTPRAHIEMFRNNPERYRQLVSPEVYEQIAGLSELRTLNERYTELDNSVRDSSQNVNTELSRVVRENGGFNQWHQLSSDEQREILMRDEKYVQALGKSNDIQEEFSNWQAETNFGTHQYNDASRNFLNAIKGNQCTPEQVYEPFTGAIAENKDNPAALDSIISAFLDKFHDSYDKDIMDKEETFTGAIAPTNAEALQQFFNSEGV
jgi:hypothetical protein